MSNFGFNFVPFPKCGNCELGNVRVVKTEASGKVSEHVIGICMLVGSPICIPCVLNYPVIIYFEDSVYVLHCLKKCNAKKHPNVLSNCTTYSIWSWCGENKLKHDAQD